MKKVTNGNMGAECLKFSIFMVTSILNDPWISYWSFWPKWNFKPAWDSHVNKFTRSEISVDSLILCLLRVLFLWHNWNFISGDEIKYCMKWNACVSPSKYRVVLKCSRNGTSSEQNFFSRWFEISNRYEFILWTYF